MKRDSNLEDQIKINKVIYGLMIIKIIYYTTALVVSAYFIAMLWYVMVEFTIDSMVNTHVFDDHIDNPHTFFNHTGVHKLYEYPND